MKARGAAATLLAAAALVAFVARPGHRLVLIALVAVLVGLGLANLVVLRRTRGEPQHEAIAIMTVGCVVAATATVLSTLRGSGAMPFPASSTIGTTIGVGIAVVGLFALLRATHQDRAVGVLFEGALCFAALAFFPWAASANDGAPATAALEYIPALVDALAICLALRLMWNSRAQRAPYRWLVRVFACMLALDIVATTGILGTDFISDPDLAALRLAVCAVWAIAMLSPTLGVSTERWLSPPSPLGPGKVAAPLGLTLLAPALFALQSISGDVPPLSVVLGGSSVLAFLVAAYLVRQVQEASRAEYRAHHDPLTGLPHRVLFQDRLEFALSQAGRNDTRVGVMFLDLDRFKTINDSLGHSVGNQLLQQVAQRLDRGVRSGDTVARMGGDEFMILLPGVGDRDDCAAVAEKLLQAFVEPFLIGSRPLVTTASIGIAIFPENGEDADALTKHADIAMYRAKAKGRDRYEIHTPDMTTSARMRHSLESHLRTAIESGGLELHHQPKIDAVTGELVGFEALARWPHPDLGLVPPKVFIPLAEETGLIVPLGEWVLEEACQRLSSWSDVNPRELPLAINMSAHEFSHTPVDRRVDEALRRHNLSPRLLELEITESLFMHDLAAGTDALYNLRNMGVRCSIDDFGTGYSGLTYLSKLPIYSLKIDQSFIQQIGARAGVEHIIEAVITLGRNLHMTVIAEGVETSGQAQFLMKHQCDQLQGWLISPALTPEQVPDLLSGTTAVSCETQPIARPDTLPGPTPRDAVVSALLEAVCENKYTRALPEGGVAEILASLEAC